MADLLKLLLILGLTIFLLMKKWDLGLVLFLNTVVVAVLFRYPVLDWLQSILRAVVAADTLNLAGAVFLVLVLAELMRRTEAMNNMVASLQTLVPDNRITVALIPLVIGLMPMLGGAMFSAPMVNEVGTPLKMSSDRKTFVNYWFRHTMEYIFPLYSSLLMISALLEVSVFEFISVSWVLTPVALLSGILWGLIGIEREARPADVRSHGPKGRVWLQLLQGTWPLVLVIISVVVFRFDMILSLIGVIALVTLTHRIGPNQWWSVIKDAVPIHTFTAIFGVMVFKHVMEDAGAVNQIPAALSMLGLPAMLVSFVVPLIVGLLTGTAAATLALSVPLVAPLLDGGGLSSMGVGLWLFVAGFSGVLLSPLHLCLALTKDYFDASWGGLYRRIVPSVALVVVAATALVLLT